MEENCPCCSGKSYVECCELFHSGTKNPSSAEKLMRSRYTAYVKGLVDYIFDTTHSSEQKYYSKKEIEKWSKANDWLKLEIVFSSEFIVEFKAYFRAKNQLNIQIHHERSTFEIENNRWKFVSGEFED